MIKIGKFIHCCQFMRDIIEEGMVDLVFANDVLEYYIPIRDQEAPLDEFRDATEFQRIDYCPWCGKKLTFDKDGALRDCLIAEIENIGFPDQFDIFHVLKNIKTIRGGERKRKNCLICRPIQNFPNLTSVLLM